MAVSAALERHAGNRTRAAAELGIHRTTLLRKMKKIART
jgi:transcriptional regulator with PAS, ATPase and Fis domain